MDIILLQDIDKVGDKHTIVTVKNGYGRNYLIPQKKAIIANAANKAKLAVLKEKEEALAQKMIGTFQEYATQLADKVIKIAAKAGEKGRIFGSVTSIQVAAALQDQFNVEIDRKKIQMPEEIKELGTYAVVLNFHKEVAPEVAIEVFAD
ncbi:MAG TPA: 50S ribosomal protein L9 [Saprospiraceae bacterium]|nr:50S ribosomal protein L9 [Saprospiraceae bacterium]